MQSDDCSAGTEAESWMYLTNLCLPGISEESGALGNWDYHIHPTIDEIAEILGRVRFGGAGTTHLLAWPSIKLPLLQTLTVQYCLSSQCIRHKNLCSLMILSN